jgi:sterol desaturase/sphingolipid hydroxylase (fatty acid hydroxylase superfamily)
MERTPLLSQQMMPERHGRKRLFQNPYLERLTHTQILVPIGIFTLLALSLFLYSVISQHFSISFLVVSFLVGILVFTLVEYLVHRYLFHISPDTPQKADFQYKFHGVHHAHPKDEDRLAMPPIVSITILSAIFGLTYWIALAYAYSFTGGFAMGYASYLFVHYMVHAFPPPKNFLRVLWINHSIHHYKNDEVAFGVSSPLWDWIFGTMPKK